MAHPPVKYSDRVADEIFRRLAAGEALRRICEDEHMPSQTAVFNWLEANAEFRGQYVMARELQADRIFDEMLEIADDSRNDWVEQFAEDGTPAGWKLNHENIQRAKLRIDARKWMAAKLAPKKYSDRIEQHLEGGLMLQVVTGVPPTDLGQDLV